MSQMIFSTAKIDFSEKFVSNNLLGPEKNDRLTSTKGVSTHSERSQLLCDNCHFR